MVMITMYNVVSADGYIARMDKDEDFIPDEMWPKFLDLCREYGFVILGRKTYDTIQAYDAHLRDSFNSLPIKKVVVSRDEKFRPIEAFGYDAVHSPTAAVELFQKISADSASSLDLSKGALLTSGPTLNTSMLNEGLISRAIIDKIPINIGEGLNIFDEGTKPVMDMLSRENLGDGVERCTYRLLKKTEDESE